MTPCVRVLIADDAPLFMDALEAILGIESQIEIAGRAHDGEEAMRLAGELEPDVVPGSEHAGRGRVRGEPGDPSRGACHRGRRPHRLLVCRGRRKGLSAGASGYVTKDRIAQDLVRTVLDAVT